MGNQQPSSETEWITTIECDRYEVNCYGQVRHKVRKQILKGRANKNGYLYVNFRIDGKNTNFAIHRIVANAFIPNPNHKPEVNHKDSNKANNCVDNLEWVDSSENKKHAYLEGARKEHQQSKPVLQFGKDGAFIKEWPSITQAAESLNCTVGAISNCALGRSKTSMGYVWRFVEGSTTKYSRTSK
jgi:hypothetical protein